MGKLDGKVAVITGGTAGMALAGAKLFVDEGAHVFITGRRQDALDEAVKQIGRNVTGVQGDAANLDDLDRLYDTVRREKGSLDVLWASAGGGEPAPLGEITEAQFDTWFGLNARGTLFTVQKALPLFNDGGSILMTGSNASLGAFPGWSVYAGSKAVQQAWARVWLNLAGEVLVGRALGHLGRRAELVHAGAVDALLAEQVLGRAEDALAGAPAATAARGALLQLRHGLIVPQRGNDRCT